MTIRQRFQNEKISSISGPLKGIVAPIASAASSCGENSDSYRTRENNSNSSSRIIIKNIPNYYTEEKLSEFVQNRVSNRITDLIIPKDKNGNSRKLAFVGFVSVENAKNAVKILQNSFLDTCRLNVAIAFAPGSSLIPRAWSRYTAGSSAYDKKNRKNEDTTTDVRGRNDGSGDEGPHSSRNNSSSRTKLVETAAPGGPAIGTPTIRYSAFYSGESKASRRSTPEKRPNKEICKPLSSSSSSSVDSPSKRVKFVEAEKIKPLKGKAAVSRREVEFANIHDNIEEEKGRGVDQNLDLDKRHHYYEGSQTVVVDSTTDEEDPLEWLKKQSRKNSESAAMFEVEVEEEEEEKLLKEEEGEESNNESSGKAAADALESLGESGRLLLLNLPYTITEEELHIHLKQYGEIAAIHICMDETRLRSNGRAFVTFAFPEHAVDAMSKLHMSIFQGRLLRALPAIPPKQTEFIEKVAGTKKKALSSYKRQLEEQLKQNSENPKTWNLLYVSATAAAETMADKLGTERRELLGVGENVEYDARNDSAAAAVALGETDLIQQTKRWMKKEGINVAAFERQGTNLLLPASISNSIAAAAQRSDDCLIVKHLPTNTKDEEIYELFSRWGPIVRYCLSPSGTVAVVQFMEAPHAKQAFKSLAYTRFKNAPLFLEWAPVDIYQNPKPTTAATDRRGFISFVVQKNITDEDSNNGNQQQLNCVHAGEEETEKLKRLVEKEDEGEIQRVSLFVKNLNFETSVEKLEEVFSSADGFVRATITTKKKTIKIRNNHVDGSVGQSRSAAAAADMIDKKRRTSVISLSAGFGFVEFASAANAAQALKRFQGIVIDGHSLLLRVSHRSPSLAAANQESPATLCSVPALVFGSDSRNGCAEKSLVAAAAAASTIDLSKLTNKLAIRNLSFEASKKDLKQLFKAFGVLVAVRIPVKADGRSRGYGFVEMSTRAEALTALKALQHTHLYGRRLIIEPADKTDLSTEAAVLKQQKIEMKKKSETAKR